MKDFKNENRLRKKCSTQHSAFINGIHLEMQKKSIIVRYLNFFELCIIPLTLVIISLHAVFTFTELFKTSKFYAVSMSDPRGPIIFQEFQFTRKKPTSILFIVGSDFI